MNDTMASEDRADQAEEERVAEVVDHFMDEVRQGARPDAENYARRHPDMAELLRQLLPALQVMQPPSADGDPPGPLAQLSAHASLGDFRLLREVGRGGMGIVYEAEQISLA